MEAARHAGYLAPNDAAWRLMASEPVQAAIRQARQTLIEIEDAGAARACLREIIDDATAPAGARIRASQIVLEMAGYYRPQAIVRPVDKPVSELTAADIDAEMARLRAVLDRLGDGAAVIGPDGSIAPMPGDPGAPGGAPESAPVAGSGPDGSEPAQDDSDQ